MTIRGLTMTKAMTLRRQRTVGGALAATLTLDYTIDVSEGE